MLTDQASHHPAHSPHVGDPPLPEHLSVRVNTRNPLHHLWLNNGTWFVHYTLHPDACTKVRVRESLRTKSLAVARRRRDALLGAPAGRRGALPGAGRRAA